MNISDTVGYALHLPLFPHFDVIVSKMWYKEKWKPNIFKKNSNQKS